MSKEVCAVEDRQQSIHDKGFSMGGTEYAKMKVGSSTLENAILNLGSLKETEKNYSNKNFILKALADKDLVTLRKISKYFYRTSGIYARACNYFANMYRYDWYVVPEVYDKKAKEDKITKDFFELLHYLDDSSIKQTCGDIALKVIVDGAYYGYYIMGPDSIMIQQLPVGYCRSRYFSGGRPAVEFDMSFFDKEFADPAYRMRILKMFPEDFQKGYVLYKQKKLKSDSPNQAYGSWYLLDPMSAIKFDLDNGDIPLFINSIPAILDLDAAQDLDRRKQMQELLKIIVQELPMDKNGDLIFDVDEARDIHNNAVQMLARAIGVDVLTTFTKVTPISISDKNTTTTRDDLEKVERSVYNSMGISQNLFNTDGNLSLKTSVLNDEGSIRGLLLQIASFYDYAVQKKSGKNRKYNFRLYMLETTQYNYQDLSKLYKEQVQIGYSKMLPQIALGHSQSFILSSAYFENNILKLNEIMIPPLMSSVMSSEDVLGKKENSNTAKTQNNTEGKEGGRPSLPDDQKSDKTLANKESMN